MSEVVVNSLHHQSIRLIDGANTQAVAFAPDGVVEAVESRDGLTLGLQSHEEIPAERTLNKSFSSMGEKVIGGFIAWARLNRIRRAPMCSDNF
jgi:gamma-glutamyl-gamma-aminobutyrate hydrolase PuuD